MRTLFLGVAVLVAGASAASAQTNVYGMDNRLGNCFTAQLGNFVSTYTAVGAQPTFFPCVDFDETATTLYVSQYYTTNYGTLDHTGSGAYSNMGSISGSVGSAVGWTVDPAGNWWYATYDSATANSNLYTLSGMGGAAVTATLVGPISATIQIDIAISSTGMMYGHSINDDGIYSIDTSTGAGTYLCPTGLLANYAQGMDFDWTDDTLYIAIYTGGGTGQWCSGPCPVVQLENTVSLNAEMEVAIEAVGGGEPGSSYCCAATQGPNACPCGNVNVGSNDCAGCQHDDNAMGATLRAAGNASVTNDTLVLMGARGVISNSSLFFQADNNLEGQNVWLGDGIRCAGGGLIRIQPRPTDSTGAANTTIGIAAKTGVAAGQTKYYQWWFRDPAGSPCGAESNTSNGYEITWNN